MQLTCLLVGLALAAPADASQVKARNLHDLVAAAGTVFVGRVEAVEFDRVRGLPVTRVSFQVDEGLRGTSEESVVLTFPGGMQANGLPYRISGLASFRPGDRMVLLTYPTSAIGLTSPVGLYQGRFEVSTGPAGLQAVVAHGPRPADLAGSTKLLDAVRKLRAGAPRMTPPAATVSSGQPVSTLGPAGATQFVYSEFMDTLRALVADDDAALPRRAVPAQTASPKRP